MCWVPREAGCLASIPGCERIKTEAMCLLQRFNSELADKHSVMLEAVYDSTMCGVCFCCGFAKLFVRGHYPSLPVPCRLGIERKGM